ncbi:MAG: DegV family protein [Lachnospiraceae bacterium]|jgi:EDD domain protein, DegV family|nr:DegV family protein [Lachnospiraceae bacterium]
MERKFVVCTDSGCDLALEWLQENEIYAIPLQYELDGQLVSDTMKHEDCHVFYENMRNGAAPKTSQLNVMQFVDFWTPIVKEHHLPIIHISLGSGVSGTYNNGCQAADIIKDELPEAEIHMIDSTLCSTGYGMLALEAAKMRDEGCELEEAINWIEEHKGNVNTWYTTDELKYLYRSGRVSKLGAILGEALNICPILNLDLEGHLIVQEKVRGLKKTIRRIHEIMDGIVENAGDQVAWVCHSDIPEKAMEFGEEMKQRYGFKDVKYTYIGPTIGSNCGPGLMAIFFWGKKRTMDGYKG